MLFGSDVLEIAVGLVLVFLMMSIIMTALQEALEGWLKTRANHLENALLELFQGDAAALKTFYDHPLIFALYQGNDFTPGQNKGKGPTYIPREAFSAALIDMMNSAAVIDSAAQKAMPARLVEAYAGLARVAANDAIRIRREVEGWYDGAMDRAAGWFKRRTQRNLFLMALAASLLLNINAVSIAQFLHANAPARARVAALAASIHASPDAGADQRTQFQTELYGAGLPMGWNIAARNWTFRELRMAERDGPFRFPTTLLATAADLSWIMAICVLILGYFTTALAAMLGAPFWFDTLNRLMVIRSTVKPKEKSPDEARGGGKS